MLLFRNWLVRLCKNLIQFQLLAWYLFFLYSCYVLKTYSYWFLFRNYCGDDIIIEYINFHYDIWIMLIMIIYLLLLDKYLILQSNRKFWLCRNIDYLTFIGIWLKIEYQRIWPKHFTGCSFKRNTFQRYRIDCIES